MAVTVLVRFWAGAQRAAGTAQTSVQATDVAELRRVLSDQPALAKVVASASFLVDEMAAADTTLLREGAVVDVLPPFAGG